MTESCLRTLLYGAFLCLAGLPAAAQLSSDKLAVCADPNNLPFSHRNLEGFENRLAEIWAGELGTEVEYTWFPQRRGFERNTLLAVDPVDGGYKCDVIMGVPAGYDLAMTTRPYYHSTYALVYLAGRGLDIGSGDELLQLGRAQRDGLRIGVFTPGPAADWLARHGMHGQMVPYSSLNGDPDAYPGQLIENELLTGELDAAILWGPIAGYFAARAQSAQVAVVPLRSEPGVRFDFPISAGVRFGDRESRSRLEGLMARSAVQTAALLAEYHVPLVDAARAELVYVSNEDAGTISVISTATQAVVGEVDVGTRPRGVEVSLDGRLIYVALSGSPKCPPSISDEECAALETDKSKDGIGIIDAGSGTVIRVLPGGSDPEEFAVDAGSGRLFVSNEDAGQLSIVDIDNGEVLQTVEVGREPEGVRLRPDRETVYVTSETDHAVTVVEAASGRVLGNIPVGLRPRDSVFSADSARAYVSAEFSASVAVVDVAAGRVLRSIELAPGSLPMGLALAPDEQRLYVANGRAQTVSVIDLDAGEVIADVRVGTRPWGVGLTADGRLLYTANGPSNDVSVIDTETLKVVATIPVGETPWGIAIGPPPPQ